MFRLMNMVNEVNEDLKEMEEVGFSSSVTCKIVFILERIRQTCTGKAFSYTNCSSAV